MTQLYDEIGAGYGTLRRPDPRIATAILRALDRAETVVNVGAGAGSYEPSDRSVVAVEPSLTMIRQRRRGSAPVVQASALELPFRAAAFAAALAILTVHHWPDRARGLGELARVGRGRAVIVTWDPATSGFWLASAARSRRSRRSARWSRALRGSAAIWRTARGSAGTATFSAAPSSISATVSSSRKRLRDPRKERALSTPRTASSARSEVRQVAPKLIELSETVLYGDVWERPGLSKRDRSLITVAALTAMYRGDQLPGHLERALANGVTRAEIGEVITHLAFYAGWPAAMTAGRIARKVFDEVKP